MEKIKVKIQAQKNIYVHNDLSNAAHHFKMRVDSRPVGDTDGIGFDILAELIFLAFTVEAKINFLGSKLIPDWQERKSFRGKLNCVLTHLSIAVSFCERPYSTLNALKKLRDSLAHGKPVHLVIDKEATLDQDEVDRTIDLSNEWESYCTVEFAKQAYEDIDCIWKQLLLASKLNIFDTITGGEHSIKFIEKLTDQETG